ncbi:MAG: GNAT family N-acetyltransferase [Bdellovibrionota bacterium]
MKEFELQPSLIGALVSLRPLGPSDFEALFAVSSDPLLWELHPERLRYQRPVFEKFFAAAIQSKGALLALDSKTGAVIGSSRFSGFSTEKNRVEIGYTFLSRLCWGKGHNAEMKKLMLDHAFKFVDEVRFYVGENNLRSRRAMEKIGARFVEKQRRTPKEGAVYNSIEYGLSKSDWLS